MADINVNIKGDSSGAQQAMRGVGDAAEEMGGGVEEATGKVEELTEATEKSSESQANVAIKFALVAKAAKEVIKFVGDSVAEYLKSSNASKDLVRVSRELDEAQKGLKRSIGEAALELAKQAQLAEAAKGALGMLQTLLKGDTEENIGREKRMNELLAAQAALRAARIKGAADDIEAASKRVLEAQRAMGIAAGQSISPDTELGAGAQAEAKAQSDARAKLYAEQRRDKEQHDAEMFQLAKKNADDLRALMKSEDESELLAERAQGRALRDALKLHQTGMWEEINANDRALEEAAKKRAAIEKKAFDEALAERKKASEKAQRDLEKQQHDWSNAAQAIGGAFVSALTDQLNKLASGGEFDAALFVGEILAATISVAGSVIGSALGQPALGSAIGNLAAMGVRAGASAISADSKKKNGIPKYHDGGWVKGGMEQVALLRRNERVLTPEEVVRMGGPSAVDSMAGGARAPVSGASQGGRSVAFHISAVDAKSVKELFSGDGSRGIREAVRTGQGALPRLLGVNPR